MKDKINKEKNLDIVELLSKRENQNLFGSSLKNKFARKKLIFKALIKGEASFKEVLGDLQKTLLIIFPIFRFLKKNQKRKIELIDRLILSRFCTNDLNNSVNLLNYKLNYFFDKDIDISKKYLHFCSMPQIVKQIIISDQYCAREFIKDNAILIDAGANIGIFSLFAHSLTPNGKIYSFEPNKKTFSILQKNIIENNLSNTVLVFHQAL